MESKNKKSENGGVVEFEEAVSLTEYGLYNISLLFVCGGLLMAVIMETMSMSYILPAAQCDLDLTLEDKSILSAISFLGVVLSSLIWGFIGDTIGRRNLVIVTTYVSVGMTILSSFSPYTWLFITLRFLNGFFIGGPSAVTYAYLGEFHDNGHRARILSWAAAFIAFATVMLPALAWLILPMQWALVIPGINFTIRPWRLLVILYGLPGLLSATLLLRFPESPKFLWVNGKTDEVLQIFKDMYARNTGNSKSMYPALGIAEQTEKNVDDKMVHSLKPSKKALVLLKSMWEQTAPLFKMPLILKTIMTCSLQFGVFASSSGFLMWTPDILNKVSAYTQANPTGSVSVCESLDFVKNQTAYLNKIDISDCSDVVDEDVFKISLMLGAVFAFGYIFIGIIINLTGKKLLLVILLTLSGTTGLTLSIAESYIVIVIVMSLFLMAGTCVGIINTVVVDLYPTQYRAMAMAISLMMGRFGAVMGSHVIGGLLESNCLLTIYVFAGDYLVLVCISMLLPIPLIIKRAK